MTKVLISMIGTGNKTSGRIYKNTDYRFDEKEENYNTPFLAAALAKHLEVDKIIFIGTAKSMWEEVYRFFTENSGEAIDEEYWMKVAELASESTFNNNLLGYEELNDTMSSVDKYLKSINKSATGKSTALIIEYGLNEKELWRNFDTIMRLTELLKDGDEIYLDITHSFRSIPLFVYLVLEFMDTLNTKKITLKGLYYGMLEARSEISYAPIVDLSPLYNISKWIRGTHDFVYFGNGYMISELMNSVSDKSKNLKEISNKAKNISDLININYLTDLQSQIQKLNLLMDNENIDNGAISYIIPLLKVFTSHLSDINTASEFQLELSKWYFDNKRFGHGYICLVESILTRLCEVYDLDLKDFNNREVMKQLLTKRRYQKISSGLEKLANTYHSINEVRNRIAHAAFYEDEKYSFRTDIDQSINKPELFMAI